MSKIRNFIFGYRVQQLEQAIDMMRTNFNYEYRKRKCIEEGVEKLISELPDTSTTRSDLEIILLKSRKIGR